MDAWAAYAPKGAASFAASLTDLTGNGNDASDPGGAPTPGWDMVNGWTFNAVTGEYLITTFTPANDQSQSVFVQYSNFALFAGFQLCGVNSNTYSFGLMPTNGAAVQYQNGNALNVAPPAAVAGNLGIAGSQGFRNGVADGGAIGGNVNVPAHALYIGCRNNGGALDRHMTGYIHKVIIYDVALTAPQVALIVTAMA